MTRAKSLLIIIGNHEALNDDTYWKALIDLCFEKNAITRNGNKLHPRI